MARILITGGAGFIGSNLAEELIFEGHEVSIIDDLSRGKLSNVPEQADFHNVSITDFEAICSLFNGVDYVYHLAALARVRPSLKLPLTYNKVNVQGTMNVLEACRLNGVKKIVFASSSSVFGDQKSPYSEKTPKKPLSPYALQKYIAEQYVEMYYDLFNLNYTILRFFNVYGPGQIIGGAYSTVIGIFIDQRERGLPLTVFGDGSHRRDFTHIVDVVEACVKGMRSGDNEDFNIGRGDNRSVLEVAKLIGGKIKRLPAVKEAKETLCDNAKARDLLKWQPQVDLDLEAIEDMS